MWFPRLGLALVNGSLVIAITQIAPVLQFAAGGFALHTLSELTRKTSVNLPTGVEMCIVAIGTAGMLGGLAVLVGLGIQWLYRNAGHCDPFGLFGHSRDGASRNGQAAP